MVEWEILEKHWRIFCNFLVQSLTLFFAIIGVTLDSAIVCKLIGGNRRKRLGYKFAPF